jgi:hypothetical protein
MQQLLPGARLNWERIGPLVKLVVAMGEGEKMKWEGGGMKDE